MRIRFVIEALGYGDLIRDVELGFRPVEGEMIFTECGEAHVTESVYMMAFDMIRVELDELVEGDGDGCAKHLLACGWRVAENSNSMEDPWRPAKKPAPDFPSAPR